MSTKPASASTSAPPITLTEPPAGLYDSLPYIDVNLDSDSQLKASVAALVSQEIHSSKRRFRDFVQYVDHLYPTPPHSTESTMMRQDIEHYEQTKELPPKTSHEQSYADFDLQIPSATDLSSDEWLKLIDEITTSIGYHQKHIIHLGLHREFGKEQWVNALVDSKTQVAHYDTQIKVLQDSVDYVNKVRKYRQEQVHEQLAAIKGEANDMIDENLRLQQELYQQTVHKRQKTTQE